MIQVDHPVFSNYIPPVPRLIQVPLVFHRVGTQSANRADLDNQMITVSFLLPDPSTSAWHQLCLGLADSR
ncbi:hypothetical protein BGZ61DRAFT_466509 [Ilyonectria robusta]|uniref:uncharacterized protein n=1 Tax=Ilyonectria robusta TaxID=1079257 RepID=UPI001E8E0B02|nr:uncharacterized protein BGZ61DRAFT_466509 [Ilyonectria robusta]KAH8656445.1 hypothetical protein BGZ61DRAFT_466509 [Ilyonectria robusta]